MEPEKMEGGNKELLCPDSPNASHLIMHHSPTLSVSFPPGHSHSSASLRA